MKYINGMTTSEEEEQQIRQAIRTASRIFETKEQRDKRIAKEAVPERFLKKHRTEVNIVKTVPKAYENTERIKKAEMIISQYGHRTEIRDGRINVCYNGRILSYNPYSGYYKSGGKVVGRGMENLLAMLGS